MFKSSNIFFINTDSSSTDSCKSPAAIIWSALRDRLVRLSAGAAIARERDVLRQLSDSQLCDMGITRAQADAEAARDYFDIPNERLTMYGQLDCSNETKGNRTNAV